MKNINPNLSFEIIHCKNEVDELFLMSILDYLIIANSSFSWWAGFFNKNINHIYIPYKWFHEETKSNLILPGWNVVKY